MGSLSPACALLVRRLLPLALAVVTIALGTAPLPGQDDGAGGPKKEAQEYFTQAMALNRAKQYAKALEYYLKAHQADSSVLALDDQGLLENATNYLREQLAANPNDINHSFQLAELYSMKGQFNESLACYRKVVDLDRTTPLAQIADGEIRRLEKLLAPAPAQPAAPAPTQPAAQPQAQPAEIRALKEVVATLEDRVKDLENAVEQEKQRTKEVEDEKQKLQQEYDELKAKAETWQLYYRLYFANPRNIQDLKNRQRGGAQ